jgi:hypothetical protein
MGHDRTTRYRINRREFLDDDPETTDFVLGVVQDTSDISTGEVQDTRGTALLSLGDYADRVSFYFEMGNADELISSLRKITLIAEVVNQVREAVAAEIDLRNSRIQIQDHSDGAIA